MLGRTLVLSCLSFLCGCPPEVVPIPVPQSTGPVASSRANIDERTQDPVIAAQTTRTQILLMLGEPDGRAPDDSWFTYGTVARRGGIKWLFMAPIGHPNTSKLLLMHFDSRGVVSSVEFSRRDCTEEEHTCLEATGGDLLAVDDTQINASGKVLAQYDYHSVTFEWRSQTCSLKDKSDYDAGYADAFVASRLFSGAIRVAHPDGGHSRLVTCRT